MEEKLKIIRVGETYLKFDFEYNKSNQDKVREAYLTQIAPLVRDKLKNKEFLKIAIEFDKGSLKTRIVVLGTAIYLGVVNYGSFRSGVREIINDVKWFSENVIERIDDDPNINQNDIIRTEKRTGLTGRIQVVYNRIDRLERNVNTLSNKEVKVELQQIKQEVSNLVAVLPNKSGQAFLNDLEPKYRQKLPEPKKRRTTYLLNRYFMKPDDEIEFLDE